MEMTESEGGLCRQHVSEGVTREPPGKRGGRRIPPPSDRCVTQTALSHLVSGSLTAHSAPLLRTKPHVRVRQVHTEHFWNVNGISSTQVEAGFLSSPFNSLEGQSHRRLRYA